MLNKLRSFFTGSPDKSAATALPDIVDPKVVNKQQTQAAYTRRTPTTTGDNKLAAADRRTANTDLLTLRNGTSTKSTIHDLSLVSPDLSASVYAYQRLVVTREFSAVARNLDGTINPEATGMVQQLLARFNYLTDYNDGFNGVSGLHALAEMLSLELRLYGSCAMELVLDKARIPNRLAPVSTTQIEFWEDGSGAPYPVQRINGQSINLDQPTFFYESLDQDLLDVYSSSPMEAALQAVLADTEFTNDVRRSVKRALHPRLDVSIDQEKFTKSRPLDIAGDADKAAAYQNNFVAQIEETVNGLTSDDALVHFDSVKFEILNNGNVTLGKEWETLQSLINAKTATGTKSPPFILGHGSGSQNVASSESLMFVKYAEGVQLKLNSIFSRALTLSARLMGADVFVQFSFARVDLRPEAELTTFRVMEQSRVLELLSIGLMTDEEASIMLTGSLPPAGAQKLSGTFFKAGSTDPSAVDTAAAQNATGAAGQSLTPDTPKAPKGPPVQRVK